MFRSRINRDKRSAFLDYASSLWFAHFTQGRSNGLEIFNEVLGFLAQPCVLV